MSGTQTLKDLVAAVEQVLIGKHAEAELAKLQKRDADAQQVYADVAGRFKVEELSPALLALAGDQLLACRVIHFVPSLSTDTTAVPKPDVEAGHRIGLLPHPLLVWVAQAKAMQKPRTRNHK